MFSLPETIAPEVINFERALTEEKGQLRAIERAATEITSRGFSDTARSESRYYIRRAMDDLTARYAAPFEHAALQSTSAVEFGDRIKAIRSEIERNISEISERTTSSTMLSVAGLVRKPPEYLLPILEVVGRLQLLDFKEARQQIGPEEAYQLLRLKTTRGGPEQLASLQSVVRSLLGVSVDAFEGEEAAAAPAARIRTSPRGPAYARPAEIDIDDFLVAANGAGIREALRIVLDLELKRPDIALIEEPEVHLHPGLERMLHEYLIKRSATVQIFLATHSTNFLDVTSKQSVFIVSKSEDGSSIHRAIAEEEILRIPGEIGLRPSTVFMYDKLVFVEGATDQDVLYALAETLNVDLVSKNIGFVKMGGSSNIGYFASDATLDLLSRRQIPMVFILDSDERTSGEIDKIRSRLGTRAKFHTFQRRELENYLLDPGAVHRLICAKLETSGSTAGRPTISEVREAIFSTASGLAERVIELRIAHELLKPVFIDRQNGSSVQDKFKASLDELTDRASKLEQSAAAIRAEVENAWESNYLNRAPGSDILSGTMSTYGLAYNKGRDAARLAVLMPAPSIAQELQSLLHTISGD